MEQNWLTIEEHENGKRILKKCAKEAEGEIVIPSGVTEIGKEAFKGCDRIISLVIPEGLRFIAFDAFCDIYGRTYCPSLANISFPSNVIYMSRGLINEPFEGTKWYDNQPEGVIYAGANAFGYKKGEVLEETVLVIKEGTKAIAPSAFEDCWNIAKVVLPNSIVSIGRDAFAGCMNLVAVLLSDSNQLNNEHEESLGTEVEGRIFKNAFCCCEKLKSVHIPSSITIIEKDAFYDCKNLDTLCFPVLSSIQSIADSQIIERDNSCVKFTNLVFDGGFPKTEKLFAGRVIEKLCINDKAVLKSFPETNQTFENCYIQELRINLAKKNCDKIPEDIISSLHLDSIKQAGRIIYAAPERCEKASLVPGYIRVTKALMHVPLEEGVEHDGDVFDINTKYIISVEPIRIERYQLVEGSIIRCASNAYERGVEYCVYEPYDKVLKKIETSLRMLSEQVGGVAGLLNQLETLVKPEPIVIKD